MDDGIGMPPDCASVAAHRPAVDQALRSFYAKWPFGMAEDRFLRFPELRESLRAALPSVEARSATHLATSLPSHALVSTFAWALNDEGPGNTFVSAHLHRQLATEVLGVLTNGSLRENHMRIASASVDLVQNPRNGCVCLPYVTSSIQ